MKSLGPLHMEAIYMREKRYSEFLKSRQRNYATTHKILDANLKKKNLMYSRLQL